MNSQHEGYKQQQNNLSKLICQKWDQVYKMHDPKIIKGSVDDLQVRNIGQHLIFINKARKQKHNMSKDVEKHQVRLQFNEKVFNFTQKSGQQLIYQLEMPRFDLQQCQNKKQTFEILVNISPIVRYHCLLVPYPYRKLPQVLRPQIIVQALQIFKYLPKIKIGFNSIGGAASINHFHFHILLNQYIDQNISVLPLQTFPRTQWQQFMISKHQIIIEEIDYKGTYAFLFTSPNSQFEQKSLAYLFKIFIDILVDQNMPHNLLISEQGSKIYLIIRNFDRYMGWLQFSGGIVCTDEPIENEDQIIRLKQYLELREKIQKLKKRVATILQNKI